KDDQAKKFADIDQEIEKNPDADEKKLLLMAKALLALDLEQTEMAQTVFEELLKSKNNLAEYVHYYYGRLLTQKQMFPQAKVQYQKILELSPNARMQMEAQFQLAQLEIAEKNFKQARNLLAQLERRQRSEEGYPNTIYYLAQAERGMGNTGPFCKWIKRLYTGFPQFQKIDNWGPQLSTDEFEGQPTRCPVNHEDRRKRIKSLQWAGLNEKAYSEIKTLRSQTSVTDKFEVDRLEVGYWVHDGEMKKALDILLPYYEQRKSDIGYLKTFATTSARAGETQAAVGSYYRIYKLAPRGKHGKEALYQAAFMSYQFQDYDGAARKFQEFMKVFPNSGLSRDARWHLAWIRYLRNDYQGAQTAFSNLLKESKGRKRGWKSFPKDRVTYWMAMSLYRLEKFDQARPLFESLAKDQLMSYYSIASQYRLKKLELLAPKTTRLAFLDPSNRITRFTAVESMIPVEDLPVVGEENETEDALASETLVRTEEETVSAPEELPAGDGAIVVTTDEEALAEAVEPESKPSFSNPVLVQRFERARDLMILGLNDWAKWDLFDIERKTSNKDYLKNLMQEYQTVENYHRSAYIAQVYFGSQRALHGLEGVRYLWEFAYPQAYSVFVNKYSKQLDVPKELVWGIMRAESTYKRDVISPVGALGLMQVMPGTGMKIAEMLKEKNFVPRSLLEPEMAVKIGARYLQRLDKKFESNIPLIAAAYNAGPHRVGNWLTNFGNLDVDEFVEHIPFLETRNYVKKVVSNYQVYSLLYSNKKDSLSYLSESLKVKSQERLVSKETWEDL
ncbi:MAG: transglycosylase SLT domain-containing protein, partial [Pseudobdellovibrionaceae bacterium]